MTLPTLLLPRSLLLCALVASGAMLSACQSGPEYIPVEPECSVPPRPVLPEIDAAELEALSDELYFRLEKRENEIVDWGLEMEAMLQALCEPGEEEPAQSYLGGNPLTRSTV